MQRSAQPCVDIEIVGFEYPRCFDSHQGVRAGIYVNPFFCGILNSADYLPLS